MTYMPPCLTLCTIKYWARVSGSNPEKGVVPSLHLDVVAIGKGGFKSPLTMIWPTFLTYLLNIHI